jgi:hypothetical protein
MHYKMLNSHANTVLKIPTTLMTISEFGNDFKMRRHFAQKKHKAQCYTLREIFAAAKRKENLVKILKSLK